MHTLIHKAQRLAASPYPWTLLFVLGMVLEGCGLYFQYVLGLPPCVRCVYERAIYLYGFVLIGVLGMFLYRWRLMRILLCVAMLGISIAGLAIVTEHLQDYYSSSPFGSTCPLRPNFFLIPLDRIWPSVFMSQGTCGKLDWSFLGLSMPVWILLSYVGSSCAALVGVLLEIWRKRK